MHIVICGNNPTERIVYPRRLRLVFPKLIPLSNWLLFIVYRLSFIVYRLSFIPFCLLLPHSSIINSCCLQGPILFVFFILFSSFQLSIINLRLSIPLWRITDSNRWPSACKADALASWANPPGSRIVNCLLSIDYWRSLACYLLLQCSMVNCQCSIPRSPAQIWTADPYIISVVL